MVRVAHVLTIFSALAIGALCAAPASADWPTLAGNAQRTSWTSEEVTGSLAPAWHTPFEPYINPKVQVICAQQQSQYRLYISTARGLYALDADTGDVLWTYATDAPLGHSPTVVGDIIYVGGMDKRLHAIDAVTGQALAGWTFYTGATGGFETSPLVIGDTVYAGNRDGFFYAFDAASGALKWRYEVGAPILFSPAVDSSGAIFFGADDAAAYAIADDGANARLLWRTQLTGLAIFRSYWPVVYNDSHVVFVGNNNLRPGRPGVGKWAKFVKLDMEEVGVGPIGASGTEPGPWPAGTPTISATRVRDYLEARPDRRTVFVLDKATGEEVTWDSDDDGLAEYAPFLWAGTHSGQRYPPAVGSDGNLYLPNHIDVDEYGAAKVVAWKFASSLLGDIAHEENAIDEPYGIAAGGDAIYWNIINGREGGAFHTATRDFWNYWSYNLRSQFPGVDDLTYGNEMNGWGLFGTVNGVYGYHGDINPPIPCNGHLYAHKFNSVIAFAPAGGGGAARPMATIEQADHPSVSFSAAQLKLLLEQELQKIVDAGHLRPGYHQGGIRDSVYYDYRGTDYFGRPSDTLWALTRALPHVDDATLRDEVRSYLQAEFAGFPPHEVYLVGWDNGAAREHFPLPEEIQSEVSSVGDWVGGVPIDSLYGIWQYAAEFGNAGEIFNDSSGLLQPPPDDNALAEDPTLCNQYIAGYLGYVGLGSLAGEDVSAQQAVLDHLLDVRVTSFAKDSPLTVPPDLPGQGNLPGGYGRAANIYRNFRYLTPELAAHLRANILAEVQGAVAEYEYVAPGWFVNAFNAGAGETATDSLFVIFPMFQAKAWILQQNCHQLWRALDAPGFRVGDLTYLHNLISNLEADCSSPELCGNGTLDPGEACDPPGSCPTDCDDGDSCTVDSVSGNAITCDVTCGHSPAPDCPGTGGDEGVSSSCGCQANDTSGQTSGLLLLLGLAGMLRLRPRRAVPKRRKDR